MPNSFYTDKQFYLKQFNLAYKNSSISNNSIYHKYAVYVSKQFYLKQFSLAKVRSLNVKTILFQAIQFTSSTSLVLFDP